MKAIKRNAQRNRVKWIIIAAMFMAGFLALGLYVFHWEYRPQVLELYFFRLDRGRAVFMRTPHNQTILIDGGQNGQIMQELTKVFPFYRRRIDTLILTSSLAKNAGGLAETARRYSIGRIIEPSIMGTSTALDAFEKAVVEKGIVPQKLKKGDTLTIDGIDLNILFPDPGFAFTKSNLPQMVIRISYASTSAILLGDVPKSIQKSLIGSIGTANIAEYSNSASDSLVSSDLFSEMNPSFVVISKQVRSTLSKPPKKVPKTPPFDIQKQEGTTIENLIEKGTAHFVSNGETIKLK